ncbi:serine protein kinase RIO [Ornithinicoccus hortensis]|uniref:non-specific serine/threonine protein kinase n=1 Tax=Ornithinicoccus hortensis TaxID=82346 RepID=A0A542YTN0_9MICO|nr:RIO1 family regulatory kinase/ATPase [Ornithinicoccus hortensis]TQL51446.1 RIO kinase 1 [Ornithinicoccus hortensis]
MSHPSDTGDIAPFFVFDYTPIDDPARASSPDGDDAGGAGDQRFSTYWDVERGCRGPEPRPHWVVLDSAAVDTDLGVLKTGKEADVRLIHRAATDGSGAETLMAGKYYRDLDHRSFRRSAAYTETRRARRSRDNRAVSRRSSYGREVAAGMWAVAEWEALNQYWSAGVPVPYPVQVDGTEILMEFIQVAGDAAPRLAETRPDPDLLEHYFDQVREAMTRLASLHAAHGDLSPYNMLAAGERIVIIDLPQVVDLAANPAGFEFLHRDCRNVCAWFTARGLPVDADELYADLVAYT